MNSSNDSLKKENIANKLAEINAVFKVNIHAEELLVNEYSLSSATDFLSARIEEELNGEWSTATILRKFKHSLNTSHSWNDDTALSQIFPDKKNRRNQLKAIGEKMGYSIESLLRPSKSTYGLCLVLLFLCIPAAIGISWFFSGLTAFILISVLYYLDRNGNEFRSKTLLELAEEIEWKRNMEIRKGNNQQNSNDIKLRVMKILST